MKIDFAMATACNEVSAMPEVLILGGDEVKELLTMREAVQAVERAFKLRAEGKTIMPPKIYLDLPEYHGDFRAMPAYINGSVGFKWVSVYPDNWRSNLPSVMATIILCDPKTSRLLAIMDGTYITDMRTGAAGAVAVKYLARRDSSVIGLIGAGMQARMQLLAMSEVLPGVKEVKVFDNRRDAALRYAEEMRAKLGINIHPVKAIGKATEADILITTTPSRTPLVRKRHIRPGTHINAIGADAKGKQELGVDVLKHAKIVVDDIGQASHAGEINVPLSEGRLKVDDIYGTLGEVVAGMKKGRESDQEITVFDSTGLAIQDIICAKLVYDKAKEN